jgi:precorrin-6B methylase 2
MQEESVTANVLPLSGKSSSKSPDGPSDKEKSRVDLETVTTPFNTVRVRRTGERVDLEVEGATFATWHPRHLLTGYSWDALTCGSLLRSDGPPASVLVLGLGGGTVTRQLRAALPTARLVGVEIDAGVVDLARRYMELDAQAVDVRVEDAYRFLAETSERFDAIVDDLFLTGPTDVVRSRVPAGETLDLLTSRLRDGGVLVANVITDLGEHRVVRQATRTAFLGRFAEVRVVAPPRGLNEIVVGGDRVLPRSSLDAWVPRFPDRHDRLRLAEVKVRLLRRRDDDTGA